MSQTSAVSWVEKVMIVQIRFILVLQTIPGSDSDSE